ncbi:MAG: alpha/beta hydrolase family protein [Trueperaceae bacterium]
MTTSNGPVRTGAAKVEQIPVIWAMPDHATRERRLVIWLAPGLSGMEVVKPDLERLAAAGFVAVSFDSWERGSRATEAPATLLPRAWANWPLVAWPLHGHGALEVLRVIDWAARAFDVAPPFSVGGVSAGGDIAVAAAGLDRRIGCVAAIVATPDWRRPGMRVDGALVAPGEPDAYARFFYDRIDPLTNAGSYAHRPAMTFECGADDDHVPADGALRFQEALAGVYGDLRARVRVNLHPGVGHAIVPAMMDDCVAWFAEHG